MEKWRTARREWVCAAGWNLLARLAMVDEELDDAYLEEQLGIIEVGIKVGKNRVRYAMNMALIAIGMRNSAMEKKAIASANRIGRVEVDHGETGCKTPDAASYIRRAAARKKKKGKKKAQKRGQKKARKS
jgi:hypothetical protein